MTAPVLEAVGLEVGYVARRGRRDHPVVLFPAVDLTVPPGQLVVVAGANGTGKSTLLRTLTGVQPPLAGEVRLGGDPIGSLTAIERARRVAIVTSDRPDLGLLTVWDVVAMGRHPHTGWNGTLGPDDEAVLHEAMQRTGCSALAAREAATLSDGECQRVMIARALAQKPALMVLDEPTAFLDVRRRIEITALLHGLTRDTSTSVVLCSHDLELALSVADAVWLIDETPALHVGTVAGLAADGSLRRAFGDSVEVGDDGRVRVRVLTPGA